MRDLSEQLSWQVALAAPLQLLVRLVDGCRVLGSGAAVNAVLGVDRRGCSARAGWAATFAVSDSLQSEVTVEVWERSAAPLPGKKKKVKVEGEEDEWTVDGWEVVADGTVELGATFEEGAAAERVVSLRPLKGTSGTYSQTVRLEVRAWRPSWKGLETLQPASAPPPLVEGETVGILGVAGRPELDGVSGTVAELPASGEVVVSVDAADVGADAADSDDALTRVTVPAKYVARLPPFSLEGISLRCLHDLVDAHATLLGPAATTRDLAERVIAPLTAASGLSLAAALRRARARRDVHGSLGAVRGPPDLAVAHAAAASLSSLLAALDAHAAAAGSPTSRSCSGSTCAPPRSRTTRAAARVVEQRRPRARSEGRGQRPSRALAVGAARHARRPRPLHGGGGDSCGRPTRAAHVAGRDSGAASGPRARLSGGARRLCCRRRLSRRRAHRR